MKRVVLKSRKILKHWPAYLGIIVFVYYVSKLDGLSSLGIWGWAFIAVFVLVFVVFDIFLDSLFDSFLSLVGLGSGKGPLDCTAEIVDEMYIVNIENKGKSHHKIAVIEGLDLSGGKIYPTPYLSADEFRGSNDKEALMKEILKIKINSHQSVQVILDNVELRNVDYQSFYVIDMSGRKWNVVNNI